MTINNKSKNPSFAHRLGAFSSATLISRILGYVRDAMVAAYFGGGMATDAFYAAFRVPNLLRRFLGEGALTAAFVPIFTDLFNKKGKEEADRFFRSLMSGLVVVLIALTALGIWAAPWVTRVIAWGFVKSPEKFQLTVELVRLIFPFLIVVSLAALLTAVLNSLGRFFIPALAPAGLSIGEIAFMAFLANRMSHPMHGLAISVVVGGALHFLWQVPQSSREGFLPRFSKPFAHPEIRTFFILLGPTVLGMGADQVNAFVDQFCASFLRDGSVTALYNSNRLMQLPLALFGIAVSSVALPALSKSASDNNHSEFKNLLNFSLRIANFVLIPSMIGLAVLGVPIIRMLFERGLFRAEFTWLTYTALVPYAVGLPAYSAVKILATAFYARKDTKTPVQIALWAMVLHVAANFILMWKFHVAGLALSTALSAWFQAVCLFIYIRKREGRIGGTNLLSSFLYGSGAGLLMGAICIALEFWLLRNWLIYIRLPVIILSGVVFYFGFSKLFKISELEYLTNAIKRRRFLS